MTTPNLSKSTRRKVAEILDNMINEATKAFCPTGQGGGVDPTCSSGGGSGKKPPKRKELTLAHLRDFESHYLGGGGSGTSSMSSKKIQSTLPKTLQGKAKPNQRGSLQMKGTVKEVAADLEKAGFSHKWSFRFGDSTHYDVFDKGSTRIAVSSRTPNTSGRMIITGADVKAGWKARAPKKQSIGWDRPPSVPGMGKFRG